MTDIALVRTSFGSREEAERIAAAMIEHHLAACVTLSDGASIYRWQGAIERANETIALFKTRMTLADDLAAALTGAHSYDLPVIESWPVAVSPEAAKWIIAETAKT
jgi:periplasmic divalent cation tolerance protein